MQPWQIEWGRRVAAARKRAGLSQVALAARCGVAQQQVSLWEHSKVVPRDAIRVAIARALGVPVHDLFPYPDVHTDDGDTEVA